MSVRTLTFVAMASASTPKDPSAASATLDMCLTDLAFVLVSRGAK